MECITCKEIMKCVDDVNDISVRIDWLVCPKCGSKAEIVYDVQKGYITEVNWER
jgi:DNA-directed RNA polymerase subunit M/transcription elongation factor TFIIS